MKYQFIKKDVDTSALKYKDKEFDFKRDVSLQALVQGINVRARRKMLIDLTKEGITKDSLVITTIKDGKTYVDNSNLDAMENSYVEMEFLDLMNDICNKYTGMDYDKLILDIGLDANDLKEVEEFSKDLFLAIKGDNKTPSKA